MGHPYTNTLFDIYLKLKLTLEFCFCIVCTCLLWQSFNTSLGKIQSIGQNTQDSQARIQWKAVTSSFNSVRTGWCWGALLNCKITFTRIAAGEEAEQSLCVQSCLGSLWTSKCLSMIDWRLSKGITLLKNALEANSNFWLNILAIHTFWEYYHINTVKSSDSWTDCLSIYLDFLSFFKTMFCSFGVYILYNC